MSKLETWDKVKQIAAGAKDFEYVHEMAYLPTLILSFSPLKWEMEKKKTEEHVFGGARTTCYIFKTHPANLLHVRPHHLLNLHPTPFK